MFDMTYMFDSTNFNGVVILLDSELNMIRVNEVFLQLQGYKNHDVIEKSILDFVTPTDKSLFFDISYSNDISKKFLCQMYHKNGAYRFISFSVIKFKEYSLLFGFPEKKEFLGFHKNDKPIPSVDNHFLLEENIDINTIFQHDQALGYFLNVFPGDIWIKDYVGRYLFVNRTFEIHTGKKSEDVLGKDDYQIYDKKVALDFTSSDKIAIKNGQKLDYTFEANNGTLLAWTAVTKVPLYNSENEYIGILGYCFDITEFKKITLNQEKLLSSYHKSINGYFDLAFSYSYEGHVGALYGKDLKNYEVSALKKEIARVFNFEEDSRFKESLKELKNRKTTTVNCKVFEIEYTFTLVTVELSQEYSIYVMGVRERD